MVDMSVRRSSMSNWRGQPLSKYTRTSPNLRLIDAVLKAEWGFFFNGGYTVRTIRGGSSYSIHSWGAAVDSSWRNSDREKSLEAIDWLIKNSEELHIESIHDYKGSRIWHADRSTPQDNSSGGGGWKPYNGDGTGWGDWIHYETTIAGWGDETPIGLRDGLKMPGATEELPLGPCKCEEIEDALEPEWPPFAPEQGLWGLWPLAVKPLLYVGAEEAAEGSDKLQVNDSTLYFQGILRKAGFTTTIDGDFGPKTEAAARTWQNSVNRYFGLSGDDALVIDGRIGRASWGWVDLSSGL